MTDPVLSQLVSVESDLTTQVEQLETQLAHIQAQHQSLRSVIELFEEGGTASDASPTSQAATPASTKTTAKKAPAQSADKTSSKETSSKTEKAKRTATKSKPGRKPKQQTAGQKKKDGRAATWQKHVQSQYRDLALPESVSSVLRSSPSEVFTIADIMSSIFKEDMPRTAYLKARNRISNILSAGARDGTWYRGRNGRYSQSESVTKIK